MIIIRMFSGDPPMTNEPASVNAHSTVVDTLEIGESNHTKAVTSQVVCMPLMSMRRFLTSGTMGMLCVTMQTRKTGHLIYRLHPLCLLFPYHSTHSIHHRLSCMFPLFPHLVLCWPLVVHPLQLKTCLLIWLPQQPCFQSTTLWYMGKRASIQSCLIW
jgi:hypothetical protein